VRAEGHQIAPERIDLEWNPARGLGCIEMEDRARAGRASRDFAKVLNRTDLAVDKSQGNQCGGLVDRHSDSFGRNPSLTIGRNSHYLKAAIFEIQQGRENGRVLDRRGNHLAPRAERPQRTRNGEIV
jgi:hypothetical protein